jgi:cytoskeletal protein CcmA (bactofilin family)
MMAETSAEFPTTIGADATFKGQLQFEKGVRLLGKFEGEITSDGEMVIAEGAALVGDVKAGTIRIDGKVKGNLHANAKVELTSNARLEGDLEAARLEVAEGAVLIGRCVVGVNGQGKKTADVKTASAPAQAVTTGKARTNEPAAVGAKR